MIFKLFNKLKKNTFLFFLSLLPLTYSFSQNEKLERETFTFRLNISAGHYIDIPVLKSKYFIKDDILQIYPTEKLFIEIEIKKDSIFSLTTVKENKNPKKTIEIEFKKIPEDENGSIMVFSISNPFKKELYFDLYYLRNEEDFLTPNEFDFPFHAEKESKTERRWNFWVIFLRMNNWRFEK